MPPSVTGSFRGTASWCDSEMLEEKLLQILRLSFGWFDVERRNLRDTLNADLIASLLDGLGVSEQSMFGQIVAFYWPGDARLGKISFLSYPTEMGPARRSAELLANFLIPIRGPRGFPLQVILVCHSLGNRVALELIRVLGPPSGPGSLVQGLCLMAAAVPVAMVEDLSKLGRAARATRTRVLFSKSDTTLHWAFPPGETAAGEGFFPQAVGLFGNPIGLWADRFDLQPGR